MTSEDARMFAENWAQAWNALAIDRVVAHFHDGLVIRGEVFHGAAV